MSGATGVEFVSEEFSEAMSDLTSHHIEGIAIHGDTRFRVPLISQIDGNLWSGGSPEGRFLPAYFKFVVNLYPWGFYDVADGTNVMTAWLFDSKEMAENELLEGIADWVNVARSLGPTLVHCQAGLNRSGLITSLALMRAGMDAHEAVALMREKRCEAVLCNRSFEEFLYELEEEGGGS